MGPILKHGILLQIAILATTLVVDIGPVLEQGVFFKVPLLVAILVIDVHPVFSLPLP
jgi:hypothetical protein